MHAPEAWRVERVQQVYETKDRATAERMVRDADRARGRFVKAVAGIDWCDTRAYDLALDADALGFDAAADIIVRASAARFERRALGDLSR